MTQFRLSPLIAAMFVTACQTVAAVDEVPDGPALQASSEDTARIEALDARIFEAAFLTCDAETLREIMSDGLEFYHDKYGIIARSAVDFIDGTLPDCEQRKAGELPYLERRATPGTMEVRRIGDDGLMQTGHHAFWLRPPDEEIREVETGLYTHIWVRDGDALRLLRVISYDHYDTPG
ncbi:MAG: nuclear transport factor 2 family protein [Litorimonas sp.]